MHVAQNCWSSQQRIKFMPIATYLLVVLFVIIHIVSIYVGSSTMRMFNFVPTKLWRMGGITFLTATFLHASWLHLIVNSLTCYMFGIHVEHRIGGMKMLVVFVITAAVGHASYALICPASHHYSLGASGGVCGLLAFYSFAYRRDRLETMMKRLRIPVRKSGLLSMLGLRRKFNPTAAHFLCIILVWELISLGLQLAGLTNTNSAAHLGGVLAGVACYWTRKTRARSDALSTTSGATLEIGQQQHQQGTRP